MIDSDDILKEKACRIIDSLAHQYNTRYNAKIKIPVEVYFDLELTQPKWGGCANNTLETFNGTTFIKDQKIGLNMTLFRDNVKEFLNVVIPHEVAHLDQYWQLINRGVSKQISAHGYAWQMSMSVMNQLPKPCHSMDVSKSIKVYKEHKANLKKAKKEKENVKST